MTTESAGTDGQEHDDKTIFNSSMVVGQGAGIPVRDLAPELSEALKEALDEEPTTSPVYGLAGPNDLIQLLLDPKHWIALRNAFAIGAVGAAGASTWNFASKAFLKLVGTVRKALAKDVTVLFGFPASVSGTLYPRHLGVTVENADPEEIARIITLLAIHGDEISRTLVDWERTVKAGRGFQLKTSKNLEARVFMTDDGNLELRGHKDGEVFRLTGTIRGTNPR